MLLKTNFLTVKMLVCHVTKKIYERVARSGLAGLGGEPMGSMMTEFCLNRVVGLGNYKVFILE